MRFTLALALTVLLLAVPPAWAQGQALVVPPAQLRVVVLDQTGAGIPMASVIVTPPGGSPTTITTDERGVATFPALAIGSAQLHVESQGFVAVDLPLTLRRGTNNQTATLSIEGFQEQVVVDENAAGQASGGAETTKVLDDSVVDQLPDDPDELQAVLEQMAGGLGAVFRVNGFTGGRLPNREDIRQIRFRTNSFAADNHDAGRIQIEIVTRPNVQAWNGNVNANFRNDALNARDAFAAVKTPQSIMRLGTGVRGPLVSGRTSVRLNINGNRSDNPANIYAINPDGSRFVGFVSNQTRNTNGEIGIEHGLTRNQTLRVQYQLAGNETLNGGAGGFSLPERATNRHNTDGQMRLQVQGLIGRSTLNEFHIEYNHESTVVESVSRAVSINVLDAFNSGGAGVSNSSKVRRFEAADNLDFTIGRTHAMRVGFLLNVSQFRNFDARNAAGTFTFSSLEAYLAGTPLQFTQRLGEVNTAFTAYQGALYWQDDIRMTRTFTLSVGVRQEMQSQISDPLNLMPRVGVTYSPRNSKTIVRGGYGLFYDWYETNLYDQTLRVNGIAQRDLRINCPGFPDAFAPAVDAACRTGLGAGVPIVQPGGRIQASPDLKMPHVHQASISIDRPLTTNLRASVGYQRLRGRDQIRSRDINTPDPLTGLRPEPAVGSVTQFESTGRSSRDSLNVNVGYAIPRRQMNLGMNYTLAQFRNHSDNATQLPVDSYHPDLEWGPSAQDIRHRIQANLFLPPIFGLRATLNGLVYQSASPYNITTGVDGNHDLVINDRPLDDSGRTIGRNSARGSARWGDMSMRLSRAFAFGLPGNRAAQPAGGAAGRAQQGGGPRGGGGGGGGGGLQPGNNRFNLEFYAQADNVLNRVNFTNYAGTMTSRLFGRPTSSSQARRVQLGFQFRF